MPLPEELPSPRQGAFFCGQKEGRGQKVFGDLTFSLHSFASDMGNPAYGKPE